MKIGFIIPNKYEKEMESVRIMVEMMARSFDHLGHKVFVYDGDAGSVIAEGMGRGLDILILNTPALAVHAVRYLDEKTRMVLWSQMGADQPVMGGLHDKRIRQLFWGMVYASDWQRENFHQFFPDVQNEVVIPNGLVIEGSKEINQSWIAVAKEWNKWLAG